LVLSSFSCTTFKETGEDNTSKLQHSICYNAIQFTVLAFLTPHLMIFSAQKCGGTHYLLGLLCNLEKILIDSAENA
jgi:hypothetical protein